MSKKKRTTQTTNTILTKLPFRIFKRLGHAVAQLIEALSYKPEFPMLSLEFFIDIILPAALRPWVDSASNKIKTWEP
jgi:hypothetical protein